MNKACVVVLSSMLMACGAAQSAPASTEHDTTTSDTTASEHTTIAASADDDAPPPSEPAPSPAPRTPHPDIRSAGSACTTDAECVVARAECCPGCCEDDTLTAFSRADLDAAHAACAAEHCPRLECGAEDCPLPRSLHGTAACIDGVCRGIELHEDP